jgi:hypothetical protein
MINFNVLKIQLCKGEKFIEPISPEQVDVYKISQPLMNVLKIITKKNIILFCFV